MTATMRTVRFHEHGEPADVLHLENVPVPEPGPGRIRVAVHAYEISQGGHAGGKLLLLP